MVFKSVRNSLSASLLPGPSECPPSTSSKIIPHISRAVRDLAFHHRLFIFSRFVVVDQGGQVKPGCGLPPLETGARGTLAAVRAGLWGGRQWSRRGLSPIWRGLGRRPWTYETRTRDLHGVCTWSPHGSGPLLWRRPLRSSHAATVGQLMLRESARVSSTHQRKESRVVSSPEGAGLGLLVRSRVRRTVMSHGRRAGYGVIRAAVGPRRTVARAWPQRLDRDSPARRRPGLPGPDYDPGAAGGAPERHDQQAACGRRNARQPAPAAAALPAIEASVAYTLPDAADGSFSVVAVSIRPKPGSAVLTWLFVTPGTPPRASATACAKPPAKASTSPRRTWQTGPRTRTATSRSWRPTSLSPPRRCLG